MAILCVLSGPVTGRALVANALAQAGLVVDEQEDTGHGLPAGTDGTVSDLVGWLTVTDRSEDPNRAADTAAAFGWQLRAHWTEPAPPAPDPIQTLLDRVDRLEAALAARTVN